LTFALLPAASTATIDTFSPSAEAIIAALNWHGAS
jgi:hypothetical protein